MFSYLHVTNRRERWIVGLTDRALELLRVLSRLVQPAGGGDPRRPARILLLRLERVGDLLMVVDAITQVRALAPHARIDLVVGSWNAALATLVPAVDSIETLDVPWMARERMGDAWLHLIRRAWSWRTRHYDLGINFEADIRSHVLLALSGAARRVGFASGGGGPLLTDVVDADRTEHVAANAAQLVSRAFGEAPKAWSPSRAPASRLVIPADAKKRAGELLGATDAEVLIGLQPGAGRQLREWDPTRFGVVAAALAKDRRAAFVLTGSSGDAVALAAVKATWPQELRLIELPPATDLVVLAAVLERLSLLITGDTGPMHLAAAVGTPIVAIFGPSLPSRYAPLSTRARLVRIDLPCSPCNRLREPPSRCVGHVPDCLAGIEPDLVIQAAEALLDGRMQVVPLRVVPSAP